jgi:hypothetical protein
MKKLLLREFRVLYSTNTEFKQQLENYQRAVKSKEWKFFKDAVLTVKGMIYVEMLSSRFTNLDPQEKDTLQKVYFEIVQMLEFLSEPLKWIKQKSKWTGFKPTANLQGDGKQNSKRREK